MSAGAYPPTAAAAMVSPTQDVAARWTLDHAARLAFVYSRAELRAAWGEIPARVRRDLSRPRRAAMAGDLARLDTQMLGQGHSFSLVDLLGRAAEQRVVVVGTPTWWAGQHVDAATACPLRPATSPGHRWSAGDPCCRYCAVIMGQGEPVDRQR